MAKNSVKVSGIIEINKNLNKQIRSIRGRTKLGMAFVGNYVQRKAKPLTPVDTGTLTNSSGSQVQGTEREPSVAVFFTAEYAPFVHEMPDSTNWKKAGATNKFLWKAVANNVKTIVDIIAKYARVQ